MAGIEAISSQSSALGALEEFFTLLDRAGTQTTQRSQRSSSTPQTGFDSRKPLSQEQILMLLNSGNLENSLETVGQIGRDYVLTNFSDELKDTIVKEVSAPASEKGFFWQMIDDLKDTKLAKLLEGTKVGEYLGLGQKSLAAESSVLKGVTSVDAAKDVSTVTGATEGITGIGGKFLNAAGAVYGAFDLIKNFGQMSPAQGAMSGLAVGAGIGSFFPGGTLIGGAIGAAVGGLISLFRKSGKHKDQKARDQMRKALLNAGVIDDKWTIGLADGSRYDIGIDGGPKKEFGGRRPYEIDLKDPMAVKISTFLNPLTYIACGGNQKLASDLSGYLTNAALSNAGGDESKARENVKAIYGQFKITPQELVEGTSKLTKMGAISAEWGKGFISVLKDLFASQGTQKTEEKPAI